jgi:hypothetical protein
MLEPYSHIRTEAKQAAILALDQTSIDPILQAVGHKIGHTLPSAAIKERSN